MSAHIGVKVCAAPISLNLMHLMAVVYGTHRGEFMRQTLCTNENLCVKCYITRFTLKWQLVRTHKYISMRIYY